MKSILRKALACMLAVLMLLGTVAMAAETAEQFEIVGANMTLGNELVLNFMIDVSDIDDPEAYTALVTHDGETVRLPIRKYNKRYYCVSYGVAAKEMADEVSVDIVDENGDHVFETYSTSVQNYTLDLLDEYSEEEALLQTLLVDMLVYGTEAQKYFGYNEDAYAIDGLTEEQLAMRGTAGSCVNNQVAGENYYGANLSLEEQILLNLFFTVNGDVSDMYAEVAYEDYRGESKSYVTTVSAYRSNMCKVTVDQIVLADARQDVSVKLYTAEGELCGEAVDSVESYIARTSATDGDTLRQAIMAFADSAYAYLIDDKDDTDVPAEDQASADVQVGEDGAVTEDVSMEGETVSATVPAGVAVKDGTTSLVLSVNQMEDSEADVAVGENETALSLNVHVDGVADTNTKAILVNLGEVLPVGLNTGNMALYHVEAGGTVEMTRVYTMAELDEHNEYYYDPATGEVTVALASFSEIMMVNEEAKWEGNYDFGWYDPANTTHTIANADQLAGLSAVVGGMIGQTQDSFAGETINLACDIVIGETDSENGIVFYPIGYYNSTGSYEKAAGGSVSSGFKTFEGTFNGNGHTVSDWYHNTWEMFGDYNDGYAGTPNHYRDGMGLFGKVYGGTVKNLTIKNFSSDGEFTTTGCVAAYADCGATFENIAIFNCNPRVYNIGNGGIVGCIGWYARETAKAPVTFKNITVDNSNKISALWGSWDVACGGLVGQYYPTSGQDAAGNPKNAGVHFENCHVAAQIDVNNDVCANYQYYAYRYAGMIIGSIRENVNGDDGRVYPKMDGITAKGCTVNYGEWNHYYYCELVANTLASYTHDHQFSRLVIADSVDVENKTVTIDGVTTAIPESGRYNYVVVLNAEAPASSENAECYHFVDGAVWNHEDAGTETVNGETVLKENNQHLYLPFVDQLFTGYGWGVTSKGIKDFEGITSLDIKPGTEEESVTKFEYVGEDSYITGKQLYLGNLFKIIDDCGVDTDYDNVQVFVSPADDDSTVSAVYAPSKVSWGMGKLTFSGLGRAIVTITDYYFCTPTEVEVEIIEDNSPEDPEVYIIDFKQFAKDIAAQELWNDLPYEITEEWKEAHDPVKDAAHLVEMSDETRFIGRYYKASHVVDKYLWGDTEQAAYDSVIEYQKANYNWYWDEPTTGLKTENNLKGMFVNYADNITWGISMYSGQMNNFHADFNIILNVEKTGAYQMDLTAFYEGLRGAANIAATTGGGIGSGYVDILVNGKLVVDDFCLFGSYDNGRINATMPTNMAVVYLGKGENQISIRPARDLNGVFTSHRRNINLCSLTFTEVTCQHESITAYYCDACGERFIPDGHYVLDFKHFAKEVSKLDSWQQLRATAHDEVKSLGYELSAMTADNKAAYTDMQQWLSDNTCWNIDEEVTGFTTALDRKNIYINASDVMTWGIGFYATYFRCDNSRLGLTVNVDKAGAYELDMTAFYENRYLGATLDKITGGGSGQPGPGGGYADIYVNGKLVEHEHKFNPGGDVTASYTAQTTVATVWLEEGENSIVISQALNYGGNTTTTTRRYIYLRSLALAPVGCEHGTNAYEYVRGEELLTHVCNTVCATCGKLSSTAVEACADDDLDYFCDKCGGPVVDVNEIFEIGSKEDLITFSTLVNMGVTELNAELTADIVLSDVNIAEAETPSATAQTDCWIYLLSTDHAIGTAEAPYAGIFDGKGHTISGLNVYYSNVRATLGDGKEDSVRDFRLGLFGTTEGATIRDLTVEGGLYLYGRNTENSKIGGIVACATDTTVTNCVNRVEMTGHSTGAWIRQSNVGGIIGLAEGCTVTRCGNEADLILSGHNMGGLIGQINASDVPTLVNECYNLGTVDGCTDVGGLVGVVGGCTNEETPTVISDCYSYGDFGNHYFELTDDNKLVAVYDRCYSGGLFGTAIGVESSIELRNLIVSAEHINMKDLSEDPMNAITRSWPTVAFPVRENLWYNESEGISTRLGSNYWGDGASAEELADPVFIRSLGAQFVLPVGADKPVLAWQCEHTETEGYVCNGDMTHTLSTVCENCSWAEAIAEAEACVDSDSDEICDTCGGAMACMHLRKEKELVMLDDGVSHEYVVTCKSVCKEELSRQAVLCTEARNFTKIVSNGDVTHTITVTCECDRVISQVTETCTDSPEDSDEACDVCNGALDCRHPKTTASYEAVGEQKHTVTKSCDACAAVTSVEENVACADEDSDAACDLCGGPVEAVEPEPAPEPETT